MSTRAYVTVLGGSGWTPPFLEITSVPASQVQTYSLDALAGELASGGLGIPDFQQVSDIRGFLENHFAQAGLAELIIDAFESDLVVVEESPARTTTLSAVAGAGAVAAGFAVFGPWAIVAVPVGVFLLYAAPAAGQGFGEWVRRRFDRLAP